jgi:hypothetical protein
LKPIISVALIHYPVVNKHGAIVASAVTNLDLHDIARAARTYGAGPFFVVTPLADQRGLIQRILAHWTEGSGGTYNPKRREALELIRLVGSIADARKAFADLVGRPALVVATCARERPGAQSFRRLQRILAGGTPLLLLLGTAWGLADEVFVEADAVLEPLRGPVPYNHLSVRSAASIMLDRLVADRDDPCQINITCDRG